MTQSSLRPYTDSTSSRRKDKFRLSSNRAGSQHPIRLRPSLDWLHRLLKTEFFPSWNRYLRYLKTPFAVLVFTAVVTFVCGVVAAPQIFLLFAATACVIVIGLVYPWIAIRLVECRIEFSKVRIVEGESVSSKLLLQNRWPIPVWGLATERGFLSLPTDSPDENDVSVVLAHVPAWCRTEFTWEFTAQHRGTYPKGEVFVLTAFPFGLWSAKRRIEIANQVVVWPFPVPFRQLDQVAPRHVLHENNSTKLAGNAADVTAIRPYRTGDVMRDVHWSATARLGELMVNERQRSTESHARIILHLPRHVASRLRELSDEAPLDWAIRIVAGLCEHYSRSRTPTTLELGAQRFKIRSSRQYRMAMNALAIADSESVESEYQDNRSRSSAESQVRITIDTNAGDDCATSSRYVIEISSGRAHEMVSRRIDIDHSTPTTIQEFRKECQRISSSFNPHAPCRTPRVNRESSHAYG